MRLDITVFDEEVRRKLERMSSAGPGVQRKALTSLAAAFVRHLTRTRLSGRVGNVGLNRRTGGLARSLTFRSVGPDAVQVGFLDAQSARIARVHELGTVGKGGILPDIVPRVAKVLAWPVRAGGAALSSNVEGMAFAQRVAIPARLGMWETFRSPDMRRIFLEALQQRAEEWVRA